MSIEPVRKPFELCPLNELLERSARSFPSRIALRKRGKQGWNEYTYGQFIDAVKKVAGFLRYSGYQKGDLIGILGDNCPEWLICFMAVQWIGGIAVPLDTRAKEFEHSHIITHSGIKALFSNTRYLEGIKNIKPQLLLISMDKNNAYPDLPDIFKKFDSYSEREELHINETAVIFYTSGTTGNQKGVALSHRNIVSDINSIYQSVIFDETDRFFSVLPISHAYENTAGNLLPLSVGASITYSQPLKPREMLEDIQDAKPTIMLAVPLLLEKLLAGIRKKMDNVPLHIKGLLGLIKGSATILNTCRQGLGGRLLYKNIREKMGFGNLRFFVSGGAALSSWVQKGMEGFGFVVLQGYGLTEASPVAAVNPPHKQKTGSVGPAIPDTEIKIINPNNEGIGEIAIKGPNVFKEYYKNEGATKDVFLPDGFFLTGDIGYVDEEGFLYITGRKKSVIITRSGLNIFPEEIESIMLESPFVEEILVIKGQNRITGDEEAHAIIYPNFDAIDEYYSDNKTVTWPDEQLKMLLQRELDERSKKLADYKKIRSFTVRNEEFPKTSTNKIKRYLFESQN
ncbi:MAG: AMP-binding protein [Proteobacteria bacterium]|nr:AMP-binding protein [Pseudomonadota bacterium]